MYLSICSHIWINRLPFSCDDRTMGAWSSDTAPARSCQNRHGEAHATVAAGQIFQGALPSSSSLQPLPKQHFSIATISNLQPTQITSHFSNSLLPNLSFAMVALPSPAESRKPSLEDLWPEKLVPLGFKTPPTPANYSSSISDEHFPNTFETKRFLAGLEANTLLYRSDSSTNPFDPADATRDEHPRLKSLYKLEYPELAAFWSHALDNGVMDPLLTKWKIPGLVDIKSCHLNRFGWEDEGASKADIVMFISVGSEPERDSTSRANIAQVAHEVKDFFKVNGFTVVVYVHEVEIINSATKPKFLDSVATKNSTASIRNTLTPTLGSCTALVNP